jgi:alpha-glucosidase
MTNQLFGPFAGGDSVSSYKPIPHYISSRKVSLFLENKEYSRFDFSKPDRVVIKVAIGASREGVRGRITDGHSYKDLVREYTAFSGRMKPLPDWALDGVILGIQGGEGVVESVVKRTLSAKVPVTALW